MKFRDNYWFLSNMYPSEVKLNLDGVDYIFNNAEAAFQAQKDISRANEFVGLDGAAAKRLGRQVNMRPDWNTYRDTAMQNALNAKFSNADLMMMLKNVEGLIQEDNTWNDTYWGVSNGVGQNKLGQMLMNIRDSDPLEEVARINFQIKNGDIMQATEPYILQQVNARGVMGRGLAGQIRPDLKDFNKYYNFVKQNGSNSLGYVIPIGSVSHPDRVYMNIVGQDGYGTDKQYTDYNALETALNKIGNKLPAGAGVAIPYGMGAGLGGGDWNEIQKLIQNALKNQKVTYYKK